MSSGSSLDQCVFDEFKVHASEFFKLLKNSNSEQAENEVYQTQILLELAGRKL